MSSPVLLFLGAGANVGLSVIRKFTAEGWNVAAVARNPKPELQGSASLVISADFTKPESIAGIFKRVETELGVPSAVVYNAATVTPTTDTDPFSTNLSDFERDLTINVTSVFAAASGAVSSFAKLPSSSSTTLPTFIYTGNALNRVLMPQLLTLGVGKQASAHIIAAGAAAYKDKYRFYYADERLEDGRPVGRGLSGEAHAKLYLDLVKGGGGSVWEQTFVAGKGYKKF